MKPTDLPVLFWIRSRVNGGMPWELVLAINEWEGGFSVSTVTSPVILDKMLLSSYEWSTDRKKARRFDKLVKD